MAMTISYKKLWKVLVDKEMSKADLKKVSLDVLIRICDVLDCDIGDIMSVHKEETDGEKG